MSETPQVRITLRPLGSPVTLGLSGLAVASLVQSGVELHWMPAAQTVQAGVILIAVPFVLQVIACVLSYLARDGVTGSAIGLLSVTWLAVGLVHVTATPGATNGALGLLLLGAGGMLALSAGVSGNEKVVPALVFAVTAVRFVLAGVFQLGGAAGWEQAAGIAGLVVSAGAGYAVLAFELEEQRGRPLLPTLRRGEGARALEGSAIDRDRLAHEPGVRDAL